MTQNEIYEAFRKAYYDKRHLVDITGLGNYACPRFPEINSQYCLEATPSRINSLRFCPFCGIMINENIEQNNDPTERYIVFHEFPYYSDETIPGILYEKGFNYMEDAIRECDSLTSLNAGDVYMIDTENEFAIYRNGEWEI